MEDDVGLANPRDGEAEGLAPAVSPLLVGGVPAARRTRRLEPAIVRVKTMSAAHRRRRMTEAYGPSDAVAPR
jgi:hypothetical protein